MEGQMCRWLSGATLTTVISVGSIIVGCGASHDAAPPDAGADGGDADVAVDAPVTDPCVDNPTDRKCLDETKALFVSNPNGNDQDPAAGTRAKPFKTINAALAKIDPTRRRIYVCEGAYFEDLALNATHSSVSIFGGLDCAWNPAPGIKPVIGASANPLKIDGTQSLAVADIALVAKDATAGSSIALFVRGGDTSLKRVLLSAGKGATAPDASLQPFTTFPTQADLNGFNSPDTANGGPEHIVTCPGGLVTKGGKGGNPGDPGDPGTPGPLNGGTSNLCTTDVAGKPGPGGVNGAAAPRAGELKPDGWEAEAGKDGATGMPGQGGGGGFGNMGAGGGGAAGGCGGAGGAGGKGGGASIALAVYFGKIAFEASTLEAKDAGQGAKGAAGQDGQTIF